MHLHLTLRLSILMLFCVVVLGASSDELSLLDFKAKVDEDGLMGLLGSWNESTHFCSWPGVTCGHRHRDRVSELDVSNWGLKGQLSPSVGNLSFLRMLNMSNNSFSGKIPPEIGRLFRLRKLNFNYNGLGGNIPANISGCSSLQILRSKGNNLTGEIPVEVGSLSALKGIDLQANKLVGQIPPSLGNLSRLVYLLLDQNTLSGTIPASLGSLRSLNGISIADNYLEEYATGSEVSKYGDIYSFGVLLLEMFTAKRPTDIMFKDDLDLSRFASAAIPDRMTSILDPVIFEEEQDQEEIVFKSSVISVFEIGVKCSSKRPQDRRHISDVVSELHKILDLLVRRTTRNRVYNI